MTEKSEVKRMEKLLTVKEVTQIFAVNERTVRRWLVQENNPLPHIKVGGRIRIKESEMIAWVEVKK